MVSNCTVLSCIYYIFCIVLFLYRFKLHRIVLHRIVSNCTVLDCIYCIVSTVLYLLYCIVILSCHFVLFKIVSYRIASYRVTLYGIINTRPNLVEQHQRRVLQNGPSNGDTLLLPATQFQPSLSNHRLVSFNKERRNSKSH